jgi:predicted  nucleic acid-binding Zn-ribbon protein
MIFGFLILVIAISISVIAAWYSIAGLVAIFAAAAVPVIIMGAALEAGKIAATVWLHNNWERAGWRFKAYLVPAVVFLMILTSMGIFGFLSKAHLDQNIVSGDGMAKVAIYDEKIKTARENIDANRRALKQMDEAVDQLMARTTDDTGAQRAANLRRNQARERTALQADIAKNQQAIAQYNEERAPLAAEYRKIEAEVGPIKYIAALIYGEGTDVNALEQAVRWVIILIVIVFDPLALALILAGNKQLEWARRGRGGWVHDDKEEQPAPAEPIPDKIEPVINSLEDAPNKQKQEEQKQEELEQFFWRARMIARGLDADETTRIANEANAMLSEVPAEEPNYDEVIEDIRAIRTAEEKERSEKETLQSALDTLVAEYDKLVQERDVASALKTALETQLTDATAQLAQAKNKETGLTQSLNSAQTLLDAAETQRNDLQTAVIDVNEKNVSLQDQLTAAQSEVSKLQGWVDQLQSDLREAITLAAERNQKLNELMQQSIEVVSTPQEDTTQLEPTIEDPAAVAEQQTNTEPSVLDFDPKLGYEERYFAKTRAVADTEMPESNVADFGTKFPSNPGKGDMYLRVDFLPPVLYKWNGSKWIEIDRKLTDQLAYNRTYIEHLVAKLRTGEYDIDDLNETERAEIATYLNGNGTIQ